MSDDNILDPRETEAAGWSDQQWAQWFRDEVMSTSKWDMLESRWDDSDQEFESKIHYDFAKGSFHEDSAASNFARDPRTGTIDPDLVDGVSALAGAMDKSIDIYAALLRESWEHAFSRISDERKLRFFRGWNRVAARAAEADPVTPPSEPQATDASAVDAENAEERAGWGRTQYWVNITLPNGNIAIVPTGLGSPAAADADIEAPEVTINEPFEATAPATPGSNSGPTAPPPPAQIPPPPGSPFWQFGIAPFSSGCFAAVIGALIVLVAITVLAVNLLGGSDIQVAADSGREGGAPADSTAASAAAAGGTPAAAGGTPSGSGSSGLTAAPLIVHPCNVFTDAEISGLFGTSVNGTKIVDTARRAVCNYVEPGDAGGIQIEVQRNTASAGFLEEFRSKQPDAQVIPVTWGEEGELRVSSDGDGTATALWAYVITGDPLGREVFIWIDGATRGNSEAVMTVAEKLKDAILEAQP